MMYLANEIASAFVNRAIKEKSLLTHMKLQKLIYIANGIHLAMNNNEPLIQEPVENWDYGPVIKSVYRNYKIFGSSRIFFDPLENIIPNSKFDEGAKKAMDDAWAVAKDIDGVQLSNWTHKPDSPWTKAKDQGLVVIPNDEMTNYFKGFIREK